MADRRDVLALVALLLLAIGTLYPAASAGFVLVDDHEILNYSPRALADAALPRPPGLLERIVSDSANGRTRPMYWVVRHTEIALLGLRPIAWHLLYVVLGVACSVLLYAALRGLHVARLPAVLGAAWLLVAPGVSTVWIRLGPQESIATWFVLLAAWALIRAHTTGMSVLYVVSASAATLTKENFTLVPPTLLGLHLLMSNRQQLPSARVAAAIPLIVGCGVLLFAFVTARLAGTSSYGGSILDRAALSAGTATGANLDYLARDGGIVLPVLALGLLVDLARNRRLTEASIRWLSGAGLVLLLIVPQLVVYGSGAGFAVGRYILPAGLGLAAGFAAGAHWLRTTGKPALFVTSSVVWLAVLAFGALWTWYDAESFLLDSQALDGLVASVTEVAPAGSTIGIAADPVRDVELVDSLPYQLAFHGRPDLATALVGPAQRTCAGLAGVVVFTNEQPCLAGDQFRLQSFTRSADPFSVLPDFLHNLFPAIDATYAVMYPTR